MDLVLLMLLPSPSPEMCTSCNQCGEEIHLRRLDSCITNFKEGISRKVTAQQGQAYLLGTIISASANQRTFKQRVPTLFKPKVSVFA